VEGESMIEAVKSAHRLGCNPGGEVQGCPVQEDLVIADRWLSRLLSREECTQVDEEVYKAKLKLTESHDRLNKGAGH